MATFFADKIDSGSSSQSNVAIVMGSDSDWPTLEPARKVLAGFGIEPHIEVISAHRTPQRMLKFAETAATEGFKVIIAAAGGAAHLPGMIAAATTLPVIGVPVPLEHLDGMDSLLSIVQMPAGIPVATVSIGGAQNAALLALRILGSSDEQIAKQLADYAETLKQLVADKNTNLRNLL